MNYMGPWDNFMADTIYKRLVPALTSYICNVFELKHVCVVQCQ